MNPRDVEALRQRAKATEEYLRAQTAASPFAEQRHLDSGTIERAYWHHGYLMALQDILALTESPDGVPR